MRFPASSQQAGDVHQQNPLDTIAEVSKEDITVTEVQPARIFDDCTPIQQPSIHQQDSTDRALANQLRTMDLVSADSNKVSSRFSGVPRVAQDHVSPLSSVDTNQLLFEQCALIMDNHKTPQ